MKPMEMAEALFGDDDDFDITEEDFEEPAADVTVALPVVSVSAVSPVGLPRDNEKASPEAMQALAEHLRKKEGAAGASAAAVSSQAASGSPATSGPAVQTASASGQGGFIDLAKAREDALKSGAAPQHYVDSVKRRKIAAAEAKMGPSLIQPVRGVRKRTARIPAATVALGQPGAYTKPAGSVDAASAGAPDPTTAPWSVPPATAEPESVQKAASATPWSPAPAPEPEPDDSPSSPINRAASAKWAAFAQSGSHRDAPADSATASSDGASVSSDGEPSIPGFLAAGFSADPSATAPLVLEGGVPASAASAPGVPATAAPAPAASFAVAPTAGRTSGEAANLTLLGNQGTRYPQTYDPSVLETFVNKHPDNDYFVKFNCPEFTSLCPITGQPDFATIYISYVPGMRMVESKSLKLYLFSFRNHGDFHEDCINIIMKDLIALMDPKYIEVWGKFTPRGGISIDPYANYGRPGTQWEKVAWDRLTHHDMHPEKVDNR